MKKLLSAVLLFFTLCGASFAAQSVGIGNYIPYSGATQSATLGAYTIQATKVRAATFEGTGGGRIDGTTTVTTLSAVSSTIEVVSGKDVRILLGNIYTNGGYYQDYGPSSTYTGLATTTNCHIWYKKIGSTVFVNGSVEGLSNATTLHFTVPYVQRAGAGDAFAVACAVKHNGSPTDAEGVLTLPYGSNVVTAHRTGDTTADNWANDGLVKRVSFNFWYEAEPQ